jgi:hypothetical protein
MREARRYQIRIRGQLSEGWSDWFDGLSLCNGEDGDAVLCGLLPDQAALHGVLNRIRNLGIELISVNEIVTGE